VRRFIPPVAFDQKLEMCTSKMPGKLYALRRAVSELAGAHMVTADEGDSRLW
jgi:hypothetical protein